MTEGKRSLARKVAEIVAAVTYVPKSGHNSHFNYDFAQESDVLTAVRGEMAKRHLALFPSVIAHSTREMQGKNGITYVTTLTVAFTLEDGESGETRTFNVVGEGADNQDKGANKAFTAAVKYAPLKLFLIPTGRDPDGDAPAEEVPRGGQHRPAPPQQRQGSAERSSTGQLPTTFPNFGSQKGQPLAGAPEKDLKWYAKVLREHVADPNKSRFKSENAAYLAAIERALEADGGDEPNREPEDVPF